MAKKMPLILTVFLTILASRQSSASRVFELTDRFPEIRKDGGLWLVKFYAPWCGHCKKLEPIWMHVAQALIQTNIKVGKVDVTRFPTVANEFKAFATPTIKFIRPDFEHIYEGERSTEAIVNYAKRMVGGPVQEIRQPDTLDKLKKENQLFYAYIGRTEDYEGPLWDAFFSIARLYQPHIFFYMMNEDLNKESLGLAEAPAIFVHKEGEYQFFRHASTDISDFNALNQSLSHWINEERFELFPRISIETVKDVMQTGKFIVLAIVEQNKAKKISDDMLKFKNKIEALVRKKRDIYHRHFQFGWMGGPELANSILMKRVTLPYLLVLNSSTFHHHVPEDDPSEMNVEAIEIFLESVINHTSPVYGGNGLHINVARRFFDLKRNLEDMWKGNPVLLVVVFTLPSLFLLLIVWSCCCADILDADEEDENEETFHEKKE